MTTARDPDWDVLERVAGGDVESFGVLVGRHEKRLLSLCRRLLGDAEEARDAAQDVFLKLFRKAGAVEPRGQLFTLLYRIGVNHCLNRLRRRRVVRFLGFADLAGAAADENAAFEPADEDAPDPAARLEARERWQETRRLIAALPPGQRAVLVLAKLEGLSYRRIAEVLGITESAVESRLFRAMQTLVRAQEKLGRGVSPMGE